MTKVKAPPFKLKITTAPGAEGKTLEKLMVENNFRQIIEKIIITKEALISKDA